jgi:hypothetical protein
MSLLALAFSKVRALRSASLAPSATPTTAAEVASPNR